MALKYRILLLGCVFLIIFAAINILNVFPLPKDDILKEKTTEFSGVLRLWISEENSPASQGLSSWLTKESTRFEKKHDGVYVQITPVSRETLSSFSYAAELPPDMIVFSPGMLESAQGLIQIEIPSVLREEFLGSASDFSVPIAMGASFWAVREGIDPPLTGKTLLFEKKLSHAALYALRQDLSEKQSPGMQYGVDLGLPLYEEEENIIMKDAGEIRPGTESRILENSYLSFIKGEGDAVFLSQKELLLLINASAAPEIEIAATGEIYIDQLALFAVTDTKSGEGRRICEAFLHHLLSEDAQKRLEPTKAFSVTGVQLYAGKTHFQEIEMLLSGAKIHPAPAFSEESPNTENLLTSVLRGDRRIADILP